MRLVIHSRTFLPNIGGLEIMMASLATEWAKAGHQVTVFTKVAAKEQEEYPYTMVRFFSILQLQRAVAEADVFVEANISLNTCITGLLHKRKWFVIHHLPYNGKESWKGKLKNFLTRFSNNIAVSRYVATTLTGKSSVITNPYNSQFRLLQNEQNRITPFIFVGRLVSDKGADLLIQAIADLKQRGRSYQLTIVGDGPERAQLKTQVSSLQLQELIGFTGTLKGESLVSCLNKHQVMVIPSRWPEPYGIVALEGLACGCLIVCSNGGGLPEATDKFGVQFTNNNLQELIVAMEKALSLYPQFKQNGTEVEQYLFSKTLDVIARQYIRQFEEIIAVK